MSQVDLSTASVASSRWAGASEHNVAPTRSNLQLGLVRENDSHEGELMDWEKDIRNYHKRQGEVLGLS